jgi:hypothetical protein
MPYTAVSNDGRYALIVEQDLDPWNPRSWSDLGTMVCFHKRYDLGDEQPKYGVEEWERSLARDLKGNTHEAEVWEHEATRREVWEFVNEHAVVLPLYLYEHGMISISTKTFIGRAHHAMWDSGQVGWIYITHEDVEAEYGDLSEGSLQKAEERLFEEVNVYDLYVRGEVFFFSLEDLWLNTPVDSWGGIYASELDDLQDSLREHLPERFQELVEDLEWNDRAPRGTRKSPVLVVVRGGVVQGVYTNGRQDVYVIDFDEEGGGACAKIDVEDTRELDDDVLDVYEDYMGRA